jgi:hypothetical protein
MGQSRPFDHIPPTSAFGPIASRYPGRPRQSGDLRRLHKSKASEVPSDQLRKKLMVARLLALTEGAVGANERA